MVLEVNKQILNELQIKTVDNTQLTIISTHIIKQPVKIENIKSNYQKNEAMNKLKIQTIQKPNINTKTEKKCWCYNKESLDMRCCGLCYTFCYIPDKDKQCYMCPETFEIYYTSGYVITTEGSQTGEECENCLCTTLCLPFKFALFWPCLFGSLFNNAINYCRNTETNYLC
jgi:hypothetical protein